MFLHVSWLPCVKVCMFLHFAKPHIKHNMIAWINLLLLPSDASRMTLALLHPGRKKAPCVSQDALVGALMGALIPDLEKAYKGELCIQGLSDFLKHSKVDMYALQKTWC